MRHELPPGDYALMHANGATWTAILARHRRDVRLDYQAAIANIKAAELAGEVASGE